ncbi:hypothetical protein ABS71_13730 [bacterium SCN 62-11]|nr:MAG: hypothetical protein ABS71_13730 [bacterium SCN 62-11]
MRQVGELYAALGLPAPTRIVQCESPLAALKIVRDLPEPQSDPALFRRLMEVQHRVRRTFPNPFPDPPWRKTKKGSRLLSRSKLVHERLLEEFRDRPNLLRSFQFDPQIWRGDEFELKAPRCLDSDAVAETLYEVTKLASSFPIELKPLDAFQGYLWPFDEVAVVGAPPISSEFDQENRLHNSTSAAVAYADGWRVWAWNGRMVPRDLIESPERLSESVLLQTEDLQLRRWMLQRRGQPVEEPRLRKLQRMVERQQFYRFDQRHLPPEAVAWPEAIPLPVPPNRPGRTPSDGIYFQLFPDGQLQLVAWIEKEQMIYLRLDQQKASGYFHVHVGGEQYFEDGRMEDFSPWDDTSEPYFVEQSFEEWVRASLERFPGRGRSVLAQS